MVRFCAVGMRFRGNYTFKKDDVLTFTPEPQNQVDPNAICILVLGQHVAYVAKDDCNKVRRVLTKYGTHYKTFLCKVYDKSATFDLRGVVEQDDEISLDDKQ